jgi:hypothetical protein
MLLVIGLMTSGHPVFGEENGTISGKVVNGSPGAEIDEVPAVTLEAYSPGNPQPVVIQGVTDEEGNYRFTSLDTDSNISYYIAAEYKGAIYYSEELNYSGESPDIESDITVYEQTESDTDISIALSHTIITTESEGIVVTEFFIIENTGDYSFIGSGTVIGTSSLTMLFPMPDIAQGIEVGGDIAGQVTFTNQGLVYSGAIRPGFMTATYSYHLHELGSKYSLQRNIAYPQARYELLVQGIDNLSADPLTRQDPLVIENVSYQYYTATAIPAGQIVEIELSLGTDGTQIILVVGGALILAIAGFILISRQNRKGQAVVRDSGDDYTSLLNRIARLDDQYEAGDIAETDYQAKRDALKKAALNSRKRSASGEEQ